jgi:hypothetical protein
LDIDAGDDAVHGRGELSLCDCGLCRGKFRMRGREALFRVLLGFHRRSRGAEELIFALGDLLGEYQSMLRRARETLILRYAFISCGGAIRLVPPLATRQGAAMKAADLKSS